MINNNTCPILEFSRVFWWVLPKVHMWHEEFVWQHGSWMTRKNNKLSVSAFLPSSLWVISVRTRKTQVKPDCIVFLVWCSAAQGPSHVSPKVYTFMHPPAATCQRIGPVVLQEPWNHGENLSECLVMPSFVRSTVCLSVLVLKMRYSATVAAHKSCPSWLCSRNPFPLKTTPFWKGHRGPWIRLSNFSVLILFKTMFLIGSDTSLRVTTFVIVEVPPVGYQGTRPSLDVSMTICRLNLTPIHTVRRVIYCPFVTTIRRLRFTLTDSTRSSRHPFFD